MLKNANTGLKIALQQINEKLQLVDTNPLLSEAANLKAKYAKFREQLGQTMKEPSETEDLQTILWEFEKLREETLKYTQKVDDELKRQHKVLSEAQKRLQPQQSDILKHSISESEEGQHQGAENAVTGANSKDDNDVFSEETGKSDAVTHVLCTYGTLSSIVVLSVSVLSAEICLMLQTLFPSVSTLFENQVTCKT